jgi:hypothetical protein
VREEATQQAAAAAIISPHENGPRDVPRCGALIYYKSRALRWGFSRNRCWAITSFCDLTACAVQPSPLKQLSLSKQPPARFEFQQVENTKKTRNRGKYRCGGAEESKGGDGDAAATVAHAVKGGGCEETEDADTSAALPHAVAPAGAPSA